MRSLKGSALGDMSWRSILKAAAAGFVAMMLTDVISTAMVVFEAHYNATLAGLCDVLGYITGLACSVLALDSILKDGWRNKRALTIIAAVSCANYLGTVAGVLISQGLAR